MGHRPHLLTLSLLGATLGVACSTSETADDGNVVETAVLVDPAEFMGAFPCGDIDGAPKSYIATVTDLDADPPKEIGRSPRAGCSAPVAFTNIVIGNRYSASVEVFEATPEETVGAAWPKVLCGADGASGAALAEDAQQVTIRGCQQLTGPGLGETAIIVDPLDALGSLACSGDEQTDGVADITVIPVTPEDSGLPTISIGCAEGPVTFAADEIQPGVNYTFRLEAVDASAERFWGSTCAATAFEGLGVRAVCSPLAAGGTITFPLAELLADAELDCGQDVTRAKVALFKGSELVSQATVGCSADLTIAGVAAGSYLGAIELFNAAQSVARYDCTAVLEPGSNATLECEAQR